MSDQTEPTLLDARFVLTTLRSLERTLEEERQAGPCPAEPVDPVRTWDLAMRRAMGLVQILIRSWEPMRPVTKEQHEGKETQR